MKVLVLGVLFHACLTQSFASTKVEEENQLSHYSKFYSNFAEDPRDPDNNIAFPWEVKKEALDPNKSAISNESDEGVTGSK